MCLEPLVGLGIEERITWVLGGSGGGCGHGRRVNLFRPFHALVGSSGHQTASCLPLS